MTRSSRVVHGDDLLYRFFQGALASHPELFAAVPQLLIASTALWLPREAYEQWPVLLPWVVRDPTCRGSPSKGLPDQWSAPDARGFLRDDNSMIKSLPRALTVRGPKDGHMNGGHMGREFVAAHVWRVVSSSELASRIPLLNTFVPNLVWLPSQVAKLTDVEGGIVQQTLQALAWQIYRDAPVAPNRRDIVEEAWALLPHPVVRVQPFEVGNLNWFEATPAFYKTCSARLASVLEALDDVESRSPLPMRVITRRYASGLPTVSSTARRELQQFLLRFQPV